MAIWARMMARLVGLVGICLCALGASKCVFVSNTGGTSGIGIGSSTSSGGMGGGTGYATTLVLRNSSGMTSNSFLMAEPIRFDVEIQNQANQATTLQFSTAQIYDFVVVDAGTNRLRWRWSDGMAFAQVATQLTFAAYGSRSYSIVWNGILSDGTQLPSGSYQARGMIVADNFLTDPLLPSDLGSPLVSFTVR